jgi:hypothetical protein
VIEQVVVPSIVVRRLADDDHTTLVRQTGRSAQRVLWRPEAASDHSVELIDDVRGVSGDDLHAVVPSQATDHAPEEVRALRATIEQRDGQVGPIVGDHESGDTATGTEVEYGPHAGIHLEGVHEATGMRDHLGDGTGAQEAEALRVGECRDQCPVGRHRHSGGFDDDPAIRIHADGPTGDLGLVVEHVVHDLAVR